MYIEDDISKAEGKAVSGAYRALFLLLSGHARLELLGAVLDGAL
jgi:hypothetical protein